MHCIEKKEDSSNDTVLTTEGDSSKVDKDLTSDDQMVDDKGVLTPLFEKWLSWCDVFSVAGNWDHHMFGSVAFSEAVDAKSTPHVSAVYLWSSGAKAKCQSCWKTKWWQLVIIVQTSREQIPIVRAV